MTGKLRYYIEIAYKSPYRIEMFFWIAGLIYLMLINPYAQGHLDLCLFQFYGIDKCPGCGLGKSISFIFHGDIIHSIQEHPIGFIALVLIIIRVITLFFKSKKYYLITRGV